MGESGAVVVNPVVKVLAPGPALTELSDLFGLGAGANSNHRADLVRVPDAPAALPSGRDADRDSEHDAEAHEQRREPEEKPARPSEVSRPKRGHAERLEAASVLDAPASLHESTPPPSRKPWAMYLWASLMVSIIGAAGVVAYKEQKAGGAGAAAVVPGQPALRAAARPEHADAVERAPRAEAAGVSAAEAVLEIPQPEVPGKPASEAPNVADGAQAAEASKAGKTVAADEDEAGDESAESAARASRRAARRQAEANGAAENADAMSAGNLASQAAFGASRITMGVAAPSAAPLLGDGMRDPRPNANSIVPVLPSNPYEADDVPANSSP